MKTCVHCGINKSRSDFYARKDALDGLRSDCKSCVKARSVKHRIENVDSVRAYDRERSKLPHRVELRSRTYAKWKKTHPEWARAEVLLNSAVRYGKLKKWPVCAVPECNCKRVVGHHPDYSRPLDVVWLCQAHHKQAHELVPFPLARYIAATFYPRMA